MKSFSFIILYSIVFITQFKELTTIDFTYPTSIVLPNNNFFIVEKEGIYVYDSSFKNKIKSYPFDSGEVLDNLSLLSQVIIKYQDNHIICLINSKIYFFDAEGNWLLKTDTITLDSTIYHPTLAPVYIKSNYYYFIVGYLYQDNGLKFRLIYYKINLNEYSYSKITKYSDSRFTASILSHYKYRNKGLSCEFMVDNQDYDTYFLVCFFIIEESSHDTLAESFFEFESDDTVIDLVDTCSIAYIEEQYITKTLQIKTVKNSNQRLALVSLLLSTGEIYYYKFNFKYYYGGSATFYDTQKINFNCRTQLYSMKLDKLYNNNNIILSCINPTAKVQALEFQDSLGSINTYSQFQSCSSIYGHNVVYFSQKSEYYVISDVICGKYKRYFEPINGELSEIPEYIIPTTDNAIPTTEYIVPTTIVTELPTQLQTEKPTEPSTETKTDVPSEVPTETSTDEKNGSQNESISTTIITEQITEMTSDVKIEYSTEILMEENKSQVIPKTTIITEILQSTGVSEFKETQYITEFIEPFYNCSNLIKCSLCGSESASKKLCLECNTEFNYFYLNKNPSSLFHPRYIDCVNEETKPSNFYFNYEKRDYEMCYTTCSKCQFYGNEENNNCTKCDEEIYTKDREEINSSNCVVKCKYYITETGVRKCVKECPYDYYLFIEDINKCIDDCSKDREYKYRYSGKCYKICPNNTKDNNDFICKDIEVNKCFLTINSFNNINENYTIDMAENLVIKYAKEFGYTGDHVVQYIDNNDIYRLTIYKNPDCIFDLGLELPEIDFKNCEIKVRDFHSLKEVNYLIIAILDKKIKGLNKRKIISHGMFNPNFGNYLYQNDLCNNEKINFVENVESKLVQSGIKLEVFQEMAKEGVDIFDLSSPFYTDVCFQYNSKKDIALKDRVLLYFPNVSLCDENCELKGINASSFEAICECLYSETQNKDLKNSALYQSQVGTIE